jgi:threonine dehydratase
MKASLDPYFDAFLDPDALAIRYAELAPSLHRTPVLRSASLDAWAGAALHLKCENFQRSGAFKMRGVSNALRELASHGLPAGGVCTHSSGNHGQALAWASGGLGIPCTVVMPSNAPQCKKDAVRAAGGRIVECTPTLAARIEAVAEVVRATGAVEIHPSNQAPVILGQGSAAWELLEDCAARGIALDWVGVPVGGGGLLAGTGFAVARWNQRHGTRVRVFAGEPAGADDAARSLASGQIEHNDNPQTVCDGMRTELGDVNFPVIRETVTAIYPVDDSEILAAQRLIADRVKIIVETNCAPPVAAVAKHLSVFSGQQVGVVLSGGNLDLSAHAWGPAN